MFCSNCGNKMEDDAKVCSNCGTAVKSETKVAPKKKVKIQPLTAVALVISSVAWIFGFVLTTCVFAGKWVMASVDLVAVLPAFVGLSVAVYQLLDSKSDKTTKIVSFVSLGLCAFTLIYSFIGYIV